MATISVTFKSDDMEDWLQAVTTAIRSAEYKNTYCALVLMVYYFSDTVSFNGCEEVINHKGWLKLAEAMEIAVQTWEESYREDCEIRSKN